MWRLSACLCVILLTSAAFVSTSFADDDQASASAPLRTEDDTRYLQFVAQAPLPPIARPDYWTSENPPAAPRDDDDSEDLPPPTKAMPFRQAELRPQEGLKRWLDFDAYEGFMVDYDVRYYPHADVTAQPSRLDIARHHFAAGIQDSRGFGMFGINTRINWLDLNSDATLPDGRKLPSHLSDIQAEFFVPWYFPFSEFSVAFGSASDKPFASGDEMFVDITWFSGSPPGGDKNGFLFFINLNTNREFLNGIPLPGFEYRYHDKKADNLKLVLGFPYSAARWKVTDNLQINAEYEFPRTVHTSVDYVFDCNVRLYGGFDWSNERFALHDRLEKDDRLFYYEKRLTAGIRWQMRENIFLDFSGGWAFDRFFFEGRGYQDRDDNRLKIGDGPFFGITFGWKF